ncbi:MAG: hypothetical protein SRB1_00419 [Desulfobacteraceae bacterium Eth-SRB1]|nr:MAG: hypothetical protein SRB1_00419 [Desulfobacteraceae bacterium Eth-SRB1]
MKIPLPIKCSSCGRQHNIFVKLDDTDIGDSVCACGEEIFGSLDGTVTIGDKLLWRSKYEFSNNKDYPLSIVFAAASLDCELSRLFFKWSLIEELESEFDISDEELEKKLRSFSNIKSKIEKVSQLMAPESFTQSVLDSTELKEMIERGFPTLDINNLSKSFQEKLFWPRNRILHLGASDYGEKEATICFNVAELGLRILSCLDEKKCKC